MLYFDLLPISDFVKCLDLYPTPSVAPQEEVENVMIACTESPLNVERASLHRNHDVATITVSPSTISLLQPRPSHSSHLHRRTSTKK